MGDLFAAVSPAGRFMDPAYLFQKGAILQLAGAWCSSAPCIIAAFGDLKPLRHLCDPVFGTVVYIQTHQQYYLLDNVPFSLFSENFFS